MSSVEKTRNDNRWTEARYRGFIRSALRKASSKWPPKYEALNAAKTVKKINPKTGRLAQHFQCNSCKKDYPMKEVCVDHIQPVVDPEVGFVSWDVFIDRLFCEKEGLQVLCIDPCHKAKTKEETEVAKICRNKRK